MPAPDAGPFEYRGRAVAVQGLGQLFAHGHRYRLVETRANGQPAFELYRKDPHAGILHATGLLVITLADPRVSAMTMFSASALARFGLLEPCPPEARDPRRATAQKAGLMTGHCPGSPPGDGSRCRLRAMETQTGLRTARTRWS